MRLIFLSLAFVIGIFLGSKIHLSIVLIAAGLTALPLLFFARNHKKILVAFLPLIALTCGALRFASSEPGMDCLQFYNDLGAVAVKGVVTRDPETGSKTTHLYLSVTEIRLQGRWQTVSGTLLIFAPVYSDYSYGDELEVTGELKMPPEFDDFDYKGYLANQGVYATMLYPDIEILGRGRGLLEWLYTLRNRMSGVFTRVLPEPQASLAQGIILGIRGNIPDSVKEDFTESGTMHLLAISGVNLSIVAGMLTSLGIWLFGRRHNWHILLSVGVIWLYALLTGFQPPVVRSAVMASLFLTAELLGRQRSALTALSFSAAIMTAISPQLLWDGSFQMSFLAMTGLILLFPPIQVLGRKGVNAIFGEEGAVSVIAGAITDSLGISLSAILALLPLLIGYFGNVSLVSLPATVLAMPILPAIIVTGLLTGILGLFILPLVLGWLTWLFLSCLLVVTRVFASTPFSHLTASGVNVYLVLAYYLMLTSVLWLNSRHFKVGAFGVIPPDSAKPVASRISSLLSGRWGKWLTLPLLLIVTILVIAVTLAMPDDDLHVSFLDVGQGDAILIQQGSEQILVDGGPSLQKIALELGRKMPFWDRDIELVVLTHADTDHLTGLLEVLKRYHVAQVLYPDAHSDSEVYDEWQKLLAEKGLKRNTAKTGQQISLDGVITEVLSPGLNRDSADTEGIVLRVSRGRVSFLLTADITTEEELELVLERANLKSTVLKVAHHGSANSSSREFLAVVDPVAAVVSVGADNKYGHPADETMERLKGKVSAGNIYRTDEQGTIEFITDGEKLWVKKER